MKVIELAEKLKNNEIMPTHIRYMSEDLYFDGVSYYDEEGNNDILDILAMYNSNLKNLFDEVEIIEEDKKLKKIGLSEWAEITYSEDWEMLTKDFNRNSNLFVNKINEIIDYLEEKE